MIPDTMSMTTEEMLRVLQSTPPSVTHSQVPLPARVQTPAFGTTDGQVRAPIIQQDNRGTRQMEDAALILGPPTDRTPSAMVTMTSGLVDEKAVAPLRAPLVEELPTR